MEVTEYVGRILTFNLISLAASRQTGNLGEKKNEGNHLKRVLQTL